MKGLGFTVPLLRLVIPLDSLQRVKSANAKGHSQSALIRRSPSLRPQTLLRLVRIETPLEALLPTKPKASLKGQPRSPDPTLLQQALKKKTSRRPKSSNP